jgi:hypothetical protein
VSDFSVIIRDVTDQTLPEMKLFPARESLFSDIPAGDGKTANLFLQCRRNQTEGERRAEKERYKQCILTWVESCQAGLQTERERRAEKE